MTKSEIQQIEKRLKDSASILHRIERLALFETLLRDHRRVVECEVYVPGLYPEEHLSRYKPSAEVIEAIIKEVSAQKAEAERALAEL